MCSSLVVDQAFAVVAEHVWWDATSDFRNERFIIVIKWKAMRSIHDDDPRGGDDGDFHDELGCYDGAYSDDKMTPGSSCCCHDVRNPDLKRHTKTSL